MQCHKHVSDSAHWFDILPVPCHHVYPGHYQHCCSKSKLTARAYLIPSNDTRKDVYCNPFVPNVVQLSALLISIMCNRFSVLWPIMTGCKILGGPTTHGRHAQGRAPLQALWPHVVQPSALLVYCYKAQFLFVYNSQLAVFCLSLALMGCRRGEELLRKQCGLDSPKPSVNLEDSALLDRLFHLFQGSAGTAGLDAGGSPGEAAGSAPPADDWVMPAGVLLQSRIMSLFTKSILAANHFPGTVQVDCLLGARLCNNRVCSTLIRLGCSCNTVPITHLCPFASSGCQRQLQQVVSLSDSSATQQSG